MSEKTAEDQYLRHLKETRSLERLINTALGSLIASTHAPELRKPLAAHREVTRRHITALGSRLHAYDEQPSTVKDLTLRLVGTGYALLARPRRDHAGKHARDAYTLIHLLLAGYEMLHHLAVRNGDEQTARLLEQHIAEERAAAALIDTTWDLVADLSLRHAGVMAAPPVKPPHTYAKER
ncbi:MULTISPECIES: YciE/YciF ferroxidase family protein [Streptomyces]|uniref:DUF892 family protein n=1 Tax=Streptomyces siderophoricus TaxID=2802281 RepID=A0ABS1MIR2_9ACTN|nr:DUF892 family protein [Streptomyces sp. 9-7]MBL1087875.1 DUF892 family protein [Streptomyces sp. 9-7]